MNRERLLLIFNPTSGQQAFAPNLYEVVEKFTKSGYLVSAYPTQAPRDAYEMVLGHSGEYDCIVCSGGDGTLGETVDALMQLENKPKFGYIPSGTTNDFASSLGLPRDILEAAAVVTDGVCHPLDIGRFGDEYFSYVAAFGLFTDVSYGTSQGMKNALGHFAYLLEGVKRLGQVVAYPCVVDLGEERIEDEFIVGLISNSMSIGGFRIREEVYMDDGLFEVMLVRNPRNFLDTQNIIASLINQKLYTDSVILRKASSVHIRSQVPLSWSLDGEFGGELTDVFIENCHHAIEIMMPR